MPHRDVIRYADPLSPATSPRPDPAAASPLGAGEERQLGGGETPSSSLSEEQVTRGAATDAPKGGMDQDGRGAQVSVEDKAAKARAASKGGPGTAARDRAAAAFKPGQSKRPGAQPGAGRELNSRNPSRVMRGAADHQADGQFSSHQAR